LKSGYLGFFLFVLLSHHSSGLAKKACHSSSVDREELILSLFLSSVELEVEPK